VSPPTRAGAAPVYINGKFLAQRLTGVQRYATCLVQALDRRLGVAGSPPSLRCVLLLPPGAPAPVLQHIEARALAHSAASALFGLHGWEQLRLPGAARDGVLLSLSGSAPARARRQIATLHDAALWDQPGAYTRSFRLWYRALFRRLARRGGPLLTVSAFSRTRLALALGVAESRFTLVPGGSEHLLAVAPEPGALDRLQLQPGCYLLAVASANPSKNLPRLLRAWAALPAAIRAGLQLVLVGGGSPRVFAAGAEVQTASDVRLAGAVSDAALRALLDGALAMVCPSLYEGYGLPPLEAMACGCPVAAARSASLPEVLGDAALYFDPNDEAAITAALAQLIGDAALRERLRSAGRSHAATRRWDGAAAALLPLLLSQSRTAGAP
jgi:glycosyltransferase involved in cell wall biosynthesis